MQETESQITLSLAENVFGDQVLQSVFFSDTQAISLRGDIIHCSEILTDLLDKWHNFADSKNRKLVVRAEVYDFLHDMAEIEHDYLSECGSIRWEALSSEQRDESKTFLKVFTSGETFQG